MIDNEYLLFNCNTRFFRYLNLFGVSQFVFWTYLSNFATTLRDVPASQTPVADQKWFEKMTFLGENKYKNGMAVLFFIVGCGMLSLGVGFSRRCVRYLVLHRDGKTVSIVTYNHPLGSNVVKEVPLSRISTKESRQSLAPYIPMKVKDTKFFYLLDRKGQFLNPVMYDNTVGMNRHF